MTFLSERELAAASWQAYERAVVRLLRLEGCTGVRLVGQSNDKGADVIAHRGGRRWLVQVKHQRAKAGLEVVDRTLEALRFYDARFPVIVASNGFSEKVYEAKLRLQREGIPLQLWDNATVGQRIARLPQREATCPVDLREYQQDAIRLLIERFQPRGTASNGGARDRARQDHRRRRVDQAPTRKRPNLRVLAIAHTTALVLQLERSFWPFLATSDATLVWTGTEKPSCAHSSTRRSSSPRSTRRPARRNAESYRASICC